MDCVRYGILPSAIGFARITNEYYSDAITHCISCGIDKFWARRHTDSDHHGQMQCFALW